MSKICDLEILPGNFRHEKEFLKDNNYKNWEMIRNLNDLQINQIIKKNSLCTQSRFKKIRAIALFIIDLELTPHQAYLLLHAGVGSLKTLSTLNPYSLKQKIGRLERKMGVRTQSDINQKLLNDWIKKSKSLI
tara:strand:+ start:246 stop:644 length:399 start_codon:yes stop_codon:yes gene_type:complete